MTNVIYGIIKTIDDTGRFVLPIEYRKRMNITSGTKIILYENDDKLIIEVATPKCKICGSTEKVKEDLPLCEECIKRIKKYRMKKA